MRGTCASGQSLDPRVGRTGCDARRARGDYETRMEEGEVVGSGGQARGGAERAA